VKILVTGRDGQLGQSLLHQASGRRDIELIGLGRRELDLEESVGAAELVSCIQPDVIVNLAAYTAVDRAEDEPERAFLVNGEAAGDLARAARRCGAKMIQLSTDYVFDGQSTSIYGPTDAAGPLNVYGQSKLSGEEKVRAELPKHLILRTAWLVSPFGSNFLKTMLRLAHEADEIAVVADQWGSPTSALNVADGILAVLDRWRTDAEQGLGRTYHLAGGGVASWADLAEAIFDEAGRRGYPIATVKPISTASRPAKAKRPRQSGLDSPAFLHDFRHPQQFWRDAVLEVFAALDQTQVRRSEATVGPE
jgi:dTDP-4-dehydrorhamnose reductase